MYCYILFTQVWEKNGWLEEECVTSIEACSPSKRKKILNSTKIEHLFTCCSNNDLELSTQLFQLHTYDYCECVTR